MIASNAITSIAPLPSECPNCAFLAWTLPARLNARDRGSVFDLVDHNRAIGRQEGLYRAGSPLTFLHVISSGFFKTSLNDGDGRDQVTGFCMTGDLLGMDAIASGKHAADSVALESSHVCGIRYCDLEALTQRVPTMQHHFHQVLGAELMRDKGIMLLLGVMSAQERVAVFLLNLSARFVAHGYSANHFRLPMTRAEIGSYLGLKIETVSRTFSQLSAVDMIGTDGRYVELKSIPYLRRMVGQHS
jgi:CRP/FNR family transcriptional regulator